MWPLAHQGIAVVCKRCEIPVREYRCDLRLEQGQPSYGWQRVGLSYDSRAIRRAKKKEINSYGGVWYRFYGKSSIKQTVPRAGQAVLQLHPALDLIRHGPVRKSM